MSPSAPEERLREDAEGRQPSAREGESSQRTQNRPEPESWTSSLQHCEEIHVFRSSHVACGTLWWQPSGLAHLLTHQPRADRSPLCHPASSARWEMGVNDGQGPSWLARPVLLRFTDEWPPSGPLPSQLPGVACLPREEISPHSPIRALILFVCLRCSVPRTHSSRRRSLGTRVSGDAGSAVISTN